MQFQYTTRGVCSRGIEFDIQDDVIQGVNFIGGCDGNLKGLSNLVVGMPPKEAIKRLGGIKCGNRATSCPDQLSLALTEAISSKSFR